MAFKMYRKKPNRRIRRIRRKARGMRKTALTQGKIYSFKRMCALKPYYFNGTAWVQAADNVITNDSAYAYFAGHMRFRLNDLPNATDFTTLYEQFKITGVKLTFIPWIGTESSDSTGYRTAALAVAIDRGANDLNLASPSFTSLLEQQDCKLLSTGGGRPFKMWVSTPTFHTSADALTQATYKAGWLDSERTGSRDVDFHGLVYSFQQNVSTATSCAFKVYATYYVKCRNPQ